MSSKPMGTLHLLPATLGADSAATIPATTIAAARSLDYFIAENEKSARAFLSLIAHPRPLRELEIVRFDQDGNIDAARKLVEPLRTGRSAGVLSEAGCPAVADPGALLVAAAHEMGAPVVPHVGPSALLLALMASGFNGQRFAFHGYLPVEKPQRRAAILELERESRARGQTQIFIETPHRSDAMLEALLGTCDSATRLCVAVDLTLATESVRSMTVMQWKKVKETIGRRPATFVLYAG